MTNPLWAVLVVAGLFAVVGWVGCRRRYDAPAAIPQFAKIGGEIDIDELREAAGDEESFEQDWNESAERIFGWSHSEALHRRYPDFLAREEDALVAQDLWDQLRQGHVVRHRRASSG